MLQKCVCYNKKQKKGDNWGGCNFGVSRDFCLPTEAHSLLACRFRETHATRRRIICHRPIACPHLCTVPLRRFHRSLHHWHSYHWILRSFANCLPVDNGSRCICSAHSHESLTRKTLASHSSSMGSTQRNGEEGETLGTSQSPGTAGSQTQVPTVVVTDNSGTSGMWSRAIPTQAANK